MKRRRKIKKKPIIILISIILIIIIVICLIYTLPKAKKETNNIIGTWTTDNVTKYKFNKDNTGKLITSLNSYDFVYELKDDSLFIDFKNEKSTDSKYTYHFETDKLILEGENGKFTFSKIKNKES